jgi:hypothetical protein
MLREACSAPDAKRAKAILANGSTYVAAHVGGSLAFGPSRFVGYLDNSIAAHERDDARHGSLTNGRLNRLLGAPAAKSPDLDKAFKRYCASMGIDPSAKVRSYWVLDGQFESRADQEAGDLTELQRRKGALGPTMVKRLMDARRGQGAFRRDLMIEFRHRCVATGCALPDLLRASHCKPWRGATDAERLDQKNGLLLEARLDALFDRYLISFNADGEIVLSSRLPEAERTLLGLKGIMLTAVPSDARSKYLSLHLAQLRALEAS